MKSKHEGGDECDHEREHDHEREREHVTFSCVGRNEIADGFPKAIGDLREKKRPPLESRDFGSTCQNRAVPPTCSSSPYTLRAIKTAFFDSYNGKASCSAPPIPSVPKCEIKYSSMRSWFAPCLFAGSSCRYEKRFMRKSSSMS